ncbi:Uncharacterised protein [Legionella beliardensis]|uniref:Uncharacterized protein n=1 Tax=Legionella beliardensis TaxID=91822 RepID=A0A378I405_9GAMM|nr:hypothetical protein [Legionella beliardensis]STX29909.1 Uncharacterised protein [Legionella beliardensis]
MKTVMLLLLFGLSSCVFAISDNSFFILTSSEANIAPLHKNNYILNLNKPAQYVTYFIGKPKRIAGIISLSDFLSLWSNQTLKNNFSSNPPKAIVVAISTKGEQNFNAVVTNPSLVKDILSYQISVLNGQFLQIGKLKYIAIIFDQIPENIKLYNLESTGF